MDTTLFEAGEILARAKSIVICTHVMPDGDGLGAEIALFHYLDRLGKKVRIVNPDGIPDRYRFLDLHGIIEEYSSSMEWESFDLAVVMDTNDPKRVAPLWDVFKKHATDILVFDHHPDLEDHSKDSPELHTKRVHQVLDVKSSSIGELLYRLFHIAHDLLDPLHASFRLSSEIALGLYVSIITDTNSFRYSRTTALSHRIAADLIDFGLQPEEIYQNIYSTKAIGHLRLIGEVLSKVNEVSLKNSDKTIAWVEIPQALRAKHGATADDVQSIVNFLLLLKEAEILVMLREEDDGRIKASLKSKGTITVNQIAQEFGGGGHDYAAGFSAEGSMPEVRKRLLERLQK